MWKIFKVIGRAVSMVAGLFVLGVFVFDPTFPDKVALNRQMRYFRPNSALDYLQLPYGTTSLAALDGPYISGKLVVVNAQTKAFDLINLRVPEDLQARTPPEVGTVVWAEWGSRRIGEYSDKSAAWQRTCKITIINWDTKYVVGEKVIEGSMPAEVIGQYGSRTGGDPEVEVLKYLRELPREPPEWIRFLLPQEKVTHERN